MKALNFTMYNFWKSEAKNKTFFFINSQVREVARSYEIEYVKS